MKRMKTFIGFAIFGIFFFVFSNFLIHASLESTYDDITRKDNLSQVSISQAEATLINGRLKGTIYNDSKNKIDKNYLRIDFYSPRDVFLGTKYIDVSDMRENETRDLEVYFKLQDVEYYKMSFVDEKEEGELPQMLKDLTKEQVFFGILVTKLIFW